MAALSMAPRTTSWSISYSLHLLECPLALSLNNIIWKCSPNLWSAAKSLTVRLLNSEYQRRIHKNIKGWLSHCLIMSVVELIPSGLDHNQTRCKNRRLIVCPYYHIEVMEKFGQRSGVEGYQFSLRTLKYSLNSSTVKKSVTIKETMQCIMSYPKLQAMWNYVRWTFLGVSNIL